MSARSSVVNGVLTSPKERRSFKPEVESSILSGRILLSLHVERNLALEARLALIDLDSGKGQPRSAKVSERLISDPFLPFTFPLRALGGRSWGTAACRHLLIG